MTNGIESSTKTGSKSPAVDRILRDEGLEQIAEDVKWVANLYRVSTVLALIYTGFLLLQWLSDLLL